MNNIVKECNQEIATASTNKNVPVLGVLRKKKHPETQQLTKRYARIGSVDEAKHQTIEQSLMETKK